MCDSPLQCFVRLYTGQALLGSLHFPYSRLLFLDSPLECHELLFFVSLHNAVVHQFGIFVLFLNEPVVDHSFKRDHLVHMFHTNLEILIPVNLLYVDHRTPFSLAKSYIPLILEGNIFAEVPLKQIRE